MTMNKAELKNFIEVATGRKKADLVIKNCKIVNVFSGKIEEGEIAITDGKIVGVGTEIYDGEKIIDAEGKFATPGFIDAHIHIESSYVSPEEEGRLIVPLGMTTIIADPHEIANVCGIDGVRYMIDAGKKTKLNILYALPSCVPSTPFENAGAVIEAEEMEEIICDENIFGLGEFMNAPGVINADDKVLNKLALVHRVGKLIDGHAPNVTGKNLNAYIGVGIVGDHECMTVEDFNEKLSKGMYILLREGSACHDLRTLLKGVNDFNFRRVLLCSDDRQAETILTKGHIDNHLKICVEEGIDPVQAVCMATINTAEAFHLYDRGAIKTGLRADIVLLDDLKNFNVRKVFIGGELVAEDKKYLPEFSLQDISKVRGSVNVKNFSAERLKMNLKNNRVNVIGVMPGGVVTKKNIAEVKLDGSGDFIFDSEKDICKVAVIERHHGTGNIGLGFLGGYGIKFGAVAVSVAHDSHNIIVAGVNNEEMAFAVEKIIEMEGGMIVVKDKKIIASMALPIAGIMSDKSGEFVKNKLAEIHEKAHRELKINPDVEPVMTLTFMALPVIPEIKLTDRGLFDYETFNFLPLEV